MLRQVAGKADDLADQAHGLGKAPVLGVEPQFPQPFGGGAAVRVTPDLARQAGGDVLRQAHDLADLADRGAATEMDHRGAQPGAVAAVAVIDPLDHLFAAFVFEIHVDIRRLPPVFRDEAFEHHADLLGGHVGDAQQVAQDRIGGRPAPLAEDALRAGLLHDVVDGQEIGGKTQFADKRQFLGHHPVDLVGRALGIAAGKALAGQTLQPGLGGFAVRHLVGIFVAELAQAEGAARGDLGRAAQGGGMAVEKARHVGGALQPAFGVGQGAGADMVDGDPLAHAGQHVGQLAAMRAVHQHVAHGHHRRRGPERQPRAAIQIGLVGPVVTRHGPQEDMTGKAPPDLAHMGFGRAQPLLRQGDQDHAGAAFKHVVQGKVAFALLRPALAQRQQPREALVGRAVGRQGDPVHRAVTQHEARAHDQPGQTGGGGAVDPRPLRHPLAGGGVGQAV